MIMYNSSHLFLLPEESSGINALDKTGIIETEIE